MSKEKTSKDTRNVTSSPESEAGQGRLNCPAGIQTDLFGPAPVPANPFRWQGLEKALKTTDTSGRSSLDSSASADLQRCLESRLRQNLDVNGSPEYDLTLKQWDMLSGPPIFRLRAWGRRTSDKDCGGWPTSSSRDWKDTPGMAQEAFDKSGKFRNRIDQLARTAHQCASGQTLSGGPAGTKNGAGCRVEGWQTPKGTGGGNVSRGNDRSGELLLAGQAQMTGWKSPSSQEPGITTNRLVDKNGNPWTPGQMAYDKETGRLAQTGMPQMVEAALKHQAEAAGYTTPQAHDISPRGKNQKEKHGTKHGCADLNADSEKFRMPDMTGWKLNPRFSLWLMGYPIEWASCGELVTRSSRKSRKKS